MIRKFVFILIFICGFSAKSFAYYDFDRKLELAYSYILSFQFEEAEKLLLQEKIEKPGNDLSLLYLNFIDFLKAFISEEKSDLENLKANSSAHLSQLNHNKSNSSSPFHLYVQSEILMQQALVRIKFNDYLIATVEIRKAYKLIHKNKILFPKFILNQKILGLLNVIVGSVPPKYHWIVNYAGMEGDITSGLIQLQELYKNIEASPFHAYRSEIVFYLGNIYSIFSMPIDSAFILNQMLPLIPNNPLIAFVYSNIMMKAGKNEAALSALNSSIENNSSFPFIYLYYKRGIAKLRKLDLSSKKDFEYFLLHYKGLSNINSAHQKLAWIALIEGDTTLYLTNLKLCRKSGILFNEDDKAAFNESEEEEIINTNLMRSRLYFDGGYYNKSLSEITEKKIEDFPRFHDQLEVTYRLGRIMQMTGQIDKAIDYFEMTIKNGISSDYYFAANSALMLGIIYEEAMQNEKAIIFYKKCLSMEHEEYKNSIDQKALAGLERIKSIK